MRRDTLEMRSNRQELFGIGGGTSRSDPVYPPTGKRVRVGYSGRDPIHVDDAVRPSLPNMYARRSGGRPMINPVITHDLPDGGYHDHELGRLDRADHREYPKPHNYKVVVQDREDIISKGCRCADGCTWDPVTNQAEVLCRCGRNRSDEAYYPFEWEDDDKVYMGDDLRTQGLFGGNPYKC